MDERMIVVGEIVADADRFSASAHGAVLFGCDLRGFWGEIVAASVALVGCVVDSGWESFFERRRVTLDGCALWDADGVHLLDDPAETLNATRAMFDGPSHSHSALLYGAARDKSPAGLLRALGSSEWDNRSRAVKLLAASQWAKRCALAFQYMIGDVHSIVRDEAIAACAALGYSLDAHVFLSWLRHATQRPLRALSAVALSGAAIDRTQLAPVVERLTRHQASAVRSLAEDALRSLD